MNIIKTYDDPIRISEPLCIASQWLDENIYREVVKKTIVTCVDALITVSDQPGLVYLARRAVNPQQGLWYLGGRALFNSDSMPDALASNLKRETSMIFAPSRFKLIAVNDLKFINAAQGDFPCRSLSLLYRLDVTEIECRQISSQLLSSEYESGFGLEPFDRSALVRLNVHPSIIDAFDSVWPEEVK